MLLSNRVIFALSDLVGHRTRILFRYIKEARVCSREQLHLDCSCLSHGDIPLISEADDNAAAKTFKAWI